MSWSINLVGAAKGTLKLAIEAMEALPIETRVPQRISGLIQKGIDDLSLPAGSAIRVVSNGHADATSAIAYYEVTVISVV